MKKLSQIKSSGTLSDNTYNILKDAIISLDLKPGGMLIVEEISEQLGVSRTPIRTALNRLMGDGLVETIPGKGTFVTQLSEKQANDIMDIRMLLESYTIEIAASKRTTEDLENLEDIIMKQDILLRSYKNKKNDFLNYDYDLHLAIAEISRNTFLVNQMKVLMDNLRRYLNASTPEKTSLEALDEHRSLVEYISNEDVKGAKEYMVNHLNNVRRRVTGSIKEIN